MKIKLASMRSVALISVGLLVLTAATLKITASAQTPPPAAPPVPLTGGWTIDPAHTSVTFSVTHFGISQVHGRFDTMSGTISADAEHPDKSSVNFSIDASSINTDQSMRDNDLKGSGYFDVATYPTITYASTSVKKSKGGVYIVTGNLTMHGVTKPVVLICTIAGPISVMGTSRIGIVTQTTLKRLDYGIGPGLGIIGFDIPIDISAEATPTAAH